MDFEKEIAAYIVLLEMMYSQMMLMLTILMIMMYATLHRHYQTYCLKDRTFVRHETCIEELDRLIRGSDVTCIEQLRMDRHTFAMLCELFRTFGGLKLDGDVGVEEQVAIFLHILAHHVKNRVIKYRFHRSGETVSRYFNAVLNAVLRLQGVLLRSPDPIPNDCTDERWRWFKNCLGALDGTHIKVNVPENVKPRYRTRKGEIAMNMLRVCSRDMQFIYVLPGWEGSAADSRVLRDADSRRNGLKVPTDMDSEKDTCQSKEKGKESTRRVWTKTEENVLLNILEDIVKTGGRADNGQFKPGSNLKIYNHLHTILPGCGLKIQPHIESKLKAMKQEYHIICDMLQETGLGWNADLQCVEAETESHWEKYMQKAPKHKGYRNKPVPNFDRYGFIFGKDRATGEGAEGPADAVENIEAEGNNEMNMSTSVTQTTQSQPSSRKRVRSSDSLATSMKDMRSMIEVCVGSIQKSMVDVVDKLGESTNRLSKDRRLLFEELKKLPNLSPRDQLVVARKIGERPDYVDLFFSADDEFKKDFIVMLLEEGC